MPLARRAGFAGAGQAPAGPPCEGLGALLFGAVSKLVLAGLGAGLDATADDGVGAVLGGQVVLLKPRPRYPRGEQVDGFAAADPGPLRGRRGADRPVEGLQQFQLPQMALGPQPGVQLWLAA
jgi:hypothetical protein